MRICLTAGPTAAAPAPARLARCLTRRAPAAAGLALVGATLVGAALVSPACARPARPAAVPDTPAGRALRAWLDAYNAADSARLDAYARQYEPAMSVHTQLVARAQTGAYDVASIERSEPGHLEVVLRTRPDAAASSGRLTMYGTVDAAADGPAGGGMDAGGPGADGAPRVTTRLTLLDVEDSPVAGFGRHGLPELPRIDAAERAAAIDSIAAKVTRNYVLPDVAGRVTDSLRARQAQGAYADYATAVSFAERLDRDLRELGGDPQLGVEYAWQLPLPPPTPKPPAALRCGLEPARLLDGGVGYVRLYGFGGPDPTCGQQVSRAMQAVAGARALVLDLRETGDESPSGMGYLASYLVAGCTRLGDVWDRSTARIQPLFTHDGLPGPAFGGTKPLVLLTSARTFAAAEALADALQRLGRATVVGERTGGGAHVTAVGPVGEHLLVRVPIARVVNPITSTNWQGVGVAPDVPVPAGEALATAQRLLRGGRISDGRIPRASPREWPAARVGAGVLTPRTAEPRSRPGGPPLRAPPLGGPLRGVRFAVDTLTAPDAPWGGVLARVAGVVEFAGGRGRLDVMGVRHRPAVALHGVVVGAPLARPGDYYLFDNTGAVLVRPATRTFSRVAFTRADYHHTGALLPGAYLMWDTPGRADTLAAGEGDRLRQHAPVTVHWHMQPPGYERTGRLYARGWLEVADAPAVEAGVARWFEVAAALATRPGGVRALAPGGLEVTAVALLRRPGARGPAVTVAETLAPRRLTPADVDPARLVLPAGYTETRWPGFAGARDAPAPSRTAAVRWQTLDDEAAQRDRAACRQAWLPESTAPLTAPAARRAAPRATPTGRGPPSRP